MFFIAAAFFGLDQVGVMLESPFGTDAADISLLSLGKDLAEDLDVLLRTASNQAKREKPTTKESQRKLGKQLENMVSEAASMVVKAKAYPGDNRFQASLLHVSRAPQPDAPQGDLAVQKVVTTNSAAVVVQSMYRGHLGRRRAAGEPGEESLTAYQVDYVLNTKINGLIEVIKQARTAGLHVHRPTVVKAAEAALKELDDEAYKALKRRLTEADPGTTAHVSAKKQEEEDADDADDDADDDDAGDDDAGDDGGD